MQSDDDNKEKLGDKNDGGVERRVREEEKGRGDKVEQFSSGAGSSANGYVQQIATANSNR